MRHLSINPRNRLPVLSRTGAGKPDGTSAIARLPIQFTRSVGLMLCRAIVLEKPWADFHRYGLIWTHERIEFFFDGEKVSEFANDGQGPEHWPFDSPQYLIMNLALGGAWGGQQGVDDSIFPVEFRIGYVRVWQAPVK